MHKISGLNLCNFYFNFYLTKCGGRGIIETPAEPSARGAPSKKSLSALVPLHSRLVHKLSNGTVVLVHTCIAHT